MTQAEKQKKLSEVRATVLSAIDELNVNGDQHSSILGLAEALELMLIYLEQDDRC